MGLSHAECEWRGSGVRGWQAGRRAWPGAGPWGPAARGVIEGQGGLWGCRTRGVVGEWREGLAGQIRLAVLPSAGRRRAAPNLSQSHLLPVLSPGWVVGHHKRHGCNALLLSRGCKQPASTCTRTCTRAHAYTHAGAHTHTHTHTASPLAPLDPRSGWAPCCSSAATACAPPWPCCRPA